MAGTERTVNGDSWMKGRGVVTEARLVDRLVRARDVDPYLEEALLSGAAGDKALADALPKARGYRRVEIAATLAKASGGPGLDALRGAMTMTGPGSADLRYTATYSFGLRGRGEVTQDLVAALEQSATRDVALKFLGLFGESGAREQVRTALSREYTPRKRGGARYAESYFLDGIPEFGGFLYLLRYSESREEQADVLALARRVRPILARVEVSALREIVPGFDADVALDPDEAKAALESRIDRLRDEALRTA